jgi:hypothetical protein
MKMTHLPLSVNSPLRERTVSGNRFRDISALLPDGSFTSRQATTLICITAMQYHSSTNYFNSKYIYLWYELDYGMPE